jgi:acetyl esterase/lipase
VCLQVPNALRPYLLKESPVALHESRPEGRFILADEPKVQRDIPYTEPRNDRKALDVYAPPDGKNHPVVVWIHGGGWQSGDKKEVQKKPQAFVDKGFVFMSINYRLLPSGEAK